MGQKSSLTSRIHFSVRHKTGEFILSPNQLNSFLQLSMNSFLSCYRYLQNLKIVVTFCFLAIGQGPDRRLEKLNFTDIVLANFDNNLYVIISITVVLSNFGISTPTPPQLAPFTTIFKLCLIQVLKILNIQTQQIVISPLIKGSIFKIEKVFDLKTKISTVTSKHLGYARNFICPKSKDLKE